MDEAEGWFRRLEERGRAAGRVAWEARGIEHQGRIAWYRGYLDDAQALFERGLEVVPGDDPGLTADLHNDLGVVFFYRRDFERAFACHTRALDLRRALDDRLGIAKSLSNIGNLLLHLKSDYVGARDHYGQAHANAVEIGDRQMQYSALNNLGLVEMTLGRWEDALQTFDRAMSILAEIGWSFARFVTLQNRAWCEIELGRLGDAIRHLELCHGKGEAVLEPINRLTTRCYLFDAWLHVGALERARVVLEESRAMVDTMELEEEEEVLLRTARWLAADGRWEEAAELFARTAEEAARREAVAAELIARAHGFRASARRPSGTGRLRGGACGHQRAVGRARPLSARRRRYRARAQPFPGRRNVRRRGAIGDARHDAALAGGGGSTRLAARILGDPEGARAAFERAAAAADALAASLPEDLREIFEARPDVLELRRRLTPA